MSDYISGKTIIITGAGSGFGKVVSLKAAALGASMVCADINAESMAETVAEIQAAGGNATAFKVDVSDRAQMKALAAHAVETYGLVDVMINNAGIMPIAFFSDHEAAAPAWDRCIDINIKGVVNGIAAVYDQMMAQGHGHVINLSSIYGNFPVVGSGVYQATKTAVNFISESLRVEAQGKIKVTVVKPTGVADTNLMEGVINEEGLIGIRGQNAQIYVDYGENEEAGTVAPEMLDENDIRCFGLDTAHVADAIIMTINQPLGVSYGEVTIRASGEGVIL